MDSEFYEAHWINWDRVIVSGTDFNGEEVELELSLQQRDLLINFDQGQAAARKRFFREFFT